MSIHIKAEKGMIAETVLMPGDPMRAKYIAEKYLDNPVCYNDVRGMYGYTGTYKGNKLSIQGSGMGVPSFSIYAHELINDFGCKNLIRIGSCGSIKDDVKVRDVVFAMSASTDSSIIPNYFGTSSFAPTASFGLLKKAVASAESKGIRHHVGNVLTTDLFYNYREDALKPYMDFGTLAVEMEVAALYTIASKHNINSLAILTVSDHILTGEATTADEREKTFNDMIEVALDTAFSL